jgi:hypothetical protein
MERRAATGTDARAAAQPRQPADPSQIMPRRHRQQIEPTTNGLDMGDNGLKRCARLADGLEIARLSGLRLMRYEVSNFSHLHQPSAKGNDRRIVRAAVR